MKLIAQVLGRIGYIAIGISLGTMIPKEPVYLFWYIPVYPQQKKQKDFKPYHVNYVVDRR